jgi:deoxyinosine 3'endonuclease (endonuclease V)
MEYITKNTTSRSFKDHHISAFIDNSGSTSGYCNNNKIILDVEKQIVKTITNGTKTFDNSTVYWSDVIQTGTNTRPCGGTDPCCIFKNDSSRNLFKTADIIILSTDGEIPQQYVTQFADHLKNHLNKALYVCIIANSQSNNLKDLNISVISPLMITSNMLCLYYDVRTDKCYVIASRGTISTKYKNPTDYDVTKLEQIDLSQFDNLSITSQTIPPNYLILSETETQYKVVDINTMFSKGLSNLNEQEWDIVLKYCTINNSMNKLRDIINETRNHELQCLKDELKNKFDMKYTKLKDEIIYKMAEAFTASQTDVQLELKKELDLIQDLARQEEIGYMQFVKENLVDCRKKWDIIRNKLFEIDNQTNKYSLNNFGLSSNRAKRADQVTDKLDDDILERVTHTNVPDIDCAIHLDSGPAVIWIGEYPDVEYTTNDHCINFPLSFYPELAKTILANPVCGDCAESYFKNIKQTVYKQPCVGYIPLDWSNKANIAFATNVLCKAFAKNKLLSHVKMLFLSTIDDTNYNWLTFKNYVLDQLVNNIITYDTLTDEGTKDKLINVLSKAVKEEETIFRQPFFAAARIIKLAAIYHLGKGNVSKQELVNAMVKRFTYSMIEKYAILTKNGENDKVNDMIESILFDTCCGIPQMNKNKYVELDVIKEYIGVNIFDDVLKFIDKVCDLLNIDKKTILNDNVITNILWHLSQIHEHERALNTYKSLTLKSKHFRDIGVANTDIIPVINKQKFGKYKKLPKTDLISFGIYNGEYSCPTKLWFLSEPLWDASWNKKLLPFQTIADQLRLNLVNKLGTCYGSNYPNETSSHVMLHKIVAETLEKEYKHVKSPSDDILDDMIIQCMTKLRKTEGKYGNIYQLELINEVTALIFDFCQLRQTCPDYYLQSTGKTFDHKLKSELEHYGMVVVKNLITFDQDLIPKVRMINYQTDEINNIVARVNSKYNNLDKTTQSNKTSVIEETITDSFICGDSNVTIDKYLESWAKEQTDIVSKIELIDTIDLNKIKYIGGMDISFAKNELDAVACFIIHNFETMEVVAKFIIKGKIHFPYKAGYLAFREAPMLLKLLDEVKHNYPEFVPQVILMDGNGVWHPRGCGVASHFAVLTGIPCIGISKNVLYVDGVTRDSIKELMTQHAPKKGDYCKVIGGSGKELGYAYNVTGSIIKATYVSAGSYTTLDTAMKLVQHTSKYRINESVRQADLLSRMLVA